MSTTETHSEMGHARKPPTWRSLIRLARPVQWAKSVFVLVGPVYALADPAGGKTAAEVMPRALVAAGAFALASSACYIVNDLVDAPKDRKHPRKKHRPIASGAVSPTQASALAACLALGAVGLLALLPASAAWWTLIAVLVYIANVVGYSVWFKNAVMADVISLSGGFVVRVLGGCAAAGVVPSTWLLNVTFFLAMFLAFCKRLGERRLMASQGVDPASVRGVQKVYTDDLLRMSVVVTAVATLVTYAMYVQAHEARYLRGFNLLWLTLIPATYGLLRAIVLVERADYDDPTEIATHDWRVQAAAVVFGGLMLGLVFWGRA
jgi:decaprenyl-phosphate phosphoribosyltransferase